MLPRNYLLLLFLSLSVHSFSQVPFSIQFDTAEMRTCSANRIHFQYRIEQRYDSVKGKPLRKARVDTSISEYDHIGRELTFSYVNKKGGREYIRRYVDERGQVVRLFMYSDDSINGFVDQWKYNDKGQVLRQVTYSREGQKEIAFRADEFSWSGEQLVKERSYFIHKGEPELERTQHFYYTDATTIEIGVSPDKDTLYIDSSSTGTGPYWHRCYRDYRRSSGWKLSSEAKTVVDTTGDRVVQTYYSWHYAYDNSGNREQSGDTTYFDLKGNIVEWRDEQHIEKYTYDQAGNIAYVMRYNRRMQPLLRRTYVYTYYQ